MSKKTYANEPKIIQYTEDLFKPEDEVLQEVRKLCDENDLPKIQIGKMDGLYLQAITRALKVQKAVEIGTLGGYSGICIARGLSEQGKLYTFEYEEKHANIAKKSFEIAKVTDQVEVFVGPALDNLEKINKHGPFDLVFIDADKENYPHYLNWAFENMRIGGVVLGDNAFAWGFIADTNFDTAEREIAVKGLKQFNQKIAAKDRFIGTILPTSQGLTMGVKIA